MGVGAGDGNAPGFQRLAQAFKHGAREFRQLVEEQDAEVRQRHLARPRPGAAAHHGRLRSVVVGIAERPRARDAAIGQQPGDAGDHADFQHLASIDLPAPGGPTINRL